MALLPGERYVGAPILFDQVETRGARAANPLQPIASTNGPMVIGATGLSDGVLTQATFRKVYRTSKRLSAFDIQPVWANWFQHFTASETDCPNAITIKASLEYPAGTFYPFVFKGNRSVVLPPGAQVMADALPIEIPNDTQFWVRTHVQVNSGEFWPTHSAIMTASAEGMTTGSDLTLSGTPASSGTGFEPILMLGRMKGRPASCLMLGDSLLTGLADSGLNTGYVGFSGRGLRNEVLFSKMSRSSETLAMFATAASRRKRAWALRQGLFSHALILYGTNDFASTSVTADEVKANLSLIYNMCADFGVKPIAVTLPPRTNSTDNWVTLGNQTNYNSQNMTNRLTVNNWIRSFPENVAAVWDLADTTETARDSGRWKTDGATVRLWTNDGTHPSPTGHQLIAADLAAQLGNLFV
jgi:lysophospholipase L1-like esterase